MKQCLSPEMWIRLLDGELSRGEKSITEAHFSVCSHCRLMARELVRVEQILSGAGEVVRRQSAMAPEEIRGALDHFHERLRGPREIACCLDALGFFLGGMLGASAGNKVIQAAARQKEITRAAWPGFIARLAATSADLCGEGAGAIISYIGKLNLPEMA